MISLIRLSRVTDRLFRVERVGLRAHGRRVGLLAGSDS